MYTSLPALATAFVALLLPLSADAAPRVPLVERQTAYPCSIQTPGIIQPANGTVITFTDTEDLAPATFEVIFCSTQYFKTASLNASVWLGNVNDAADDTTPYGQLLAIGLTPDSTVAPAGYYGYRFNVSIYPQDGSYPTYPEVLSVYEVATGYYNPYGFSWWSIVLNFATASSSTTTSSSSTPTPSSTTSSSSSSSSTVVKTTQAISSSLSTKTTGSVPPRHTSTSTKPGSTQKPTPTPTTTTTSKPTSKSTSTPASKPATSETTSVSTSSKRLVITEYPF